MSETDSPEDQHQSENPNSEKKISRASFKKMGVLLVQRWPEYLLKIIVVIIGITISFALNRFQENTSNSKLEQTYLKGMYEDITSDIHALERVNIQTKIVLESGRELLEQSNAQKMSLEEKEIIHLVRSLMDRPNFLSKNVTFSSLKNTSNFQLIRDLDLKNLLFDYDQKYQALKTVEMAELHAVVVITGPYIMKYIPLTDSIRTEEWLKRLRLEDVLRNVEFINNVILRLDNRKELLRNYDAILNTSRKIQERLKRNLN
jgi:hypothetical protein